MIILAKLALQRRSVTIMALILVLVGGVYSYQQLQQELFPEISFRVVNIVTPYQQGTPVEVAEEVTRPIEDVVIGMEGLKEVTSTSRGSRSLVRASFETNADIEGAEAEIVSRVAGIRLPDAAGDPRVYELTPNQRPVMELSVSGQRDIPSLQKVIESQIVPRLEAVTGVFSVEIEGGVSEQVFVTVDPDLLYTYGLTLQNVIGAIQGHEVDVTAGSLVTEGRSVTLRAFHGYANLDAINNLPVGFVGSDGSTGNRSSGANATPIRISDVAVVEVNTPEASTVSRTNGQPSVSLNVLKTPEGNTIDVTWDIDVVLLELSRELPPDVDIEILESQAPRLEAELNKVVTQGLQGFGFAVLAVFLFLLQVRPRVVAGIVNSLRPTIIIGASIPLSVMLTMLVMAAFDWNLNFMSLAGLAIAVGRIVDDSIVVLENIYRHIQEGSSRATAVIAATQEVSPAIVASTLTTVAVFIPLGFLPGVVGQFFLPFAQTVCVSLLASTLVALTAVPVLASLFLRQGDMANEPSGQASDTWMQRAYTPALRLALRFRTATVLGCIVAVLSSLLLVLVLPIELFSTGRTEGLRIDLTLNQNPSTGILFREARAIEEVLDGHVASGHVDSYQSTLGSSSRNFGPGASDSSYDRAGFTVILADDAPADLDEQLRTALPGGEDVTIRVFADSGGPQRGGLRLTLTGPNYADVRSATDTLQTAIERDPGVQNVRTNIVDGSEELTIAINPDDAGRHGLSTQNVANQIRMWVYGTDVAEVNLTGEKLDLVVRGAKSAIDEPLDLQQLPIAGNGGAVPLGSISETKFTVGPNVVTHYDGNRSATISGGLVGRDAGAIGERIDAIVADTKLPPGVRVRSGGVFSDIREEFNNVYVAMVIGVSLVYLVMAATLGSLKVPFIVVLSMPLAVVGALIALVATDRSLSLPALMGFLFLIGIVVTNAIVLLTFVGQLRNAGRSPLDAVMEAGRTRLRPILMTAFTTILALIPLAFSESSGLVGAELATVVIGGLVSSTFLTLVAVPVIYMMFEESIPNLYRRTVAMVSHRPAQLGGVAEPQQTSIDDSASSAKTIPQPEAIDLKLLRFIVPSRAFRSGKVTALAACGGLLLAAVACGGQSDVAATPETSGGGPRGSRAITNEFQVRGELVFKTRANLAFKVRGEVGAVNVAVGDLVSEDDVLATLDAESLTAVERAAAQAKVDLEKAQDGLDQVMGLQSDDPLVRARAESALANADIALERAQDKLDDYQLTHNVQLGGARQAVADAKANVDRAEEQVSDFADGYSEQFAQALAVRSQAKAALDSAEDAVNDFLPRHDESIGQLSSRISQMEDALDTARDAVRDFDANHANRLAAARQQLANAEIRLEAAEDRFNDFQSTIFGDGFRGLGDGENFDVVQFNALQGAITIAQQAVNSWESEVNSLIGGPKEVDRLAAISRVGELEGTLVRLNRELNDSLAGPDSDELRRLEASVQIARSRLSRADRDLAEAEQGVDQLELARLQASADSARFSLDSAVTQLARLEEGLDQATLESLTKEVATAQEARGELVAGSDPSEVALAQANIDAAAATYERVLGDLDAAILNAPFDGVVRLVTIAPGDAVTVDARVIQVVDPQDVSVLGLVESNFIDSIELGKPATVTMSSLTGVEFSSRVTDISDDARTERGIISFPVVFDVTVPSGVSVPPYPGLVTTTVRR